MARSDLLLNLVKAGFNGERELFTKTVEAVIAEERAKHHHVLADSLAQATRQKSSPHESSLHVLLRAPATELVIEQRPELALTDLVLPPPVQTLTSQLIEEQLRADLLRSYNLEPRNRMLLIGPPGNGKTSLAEAIATELAVPLLTVRYEKVVNSYLGESAKRLQEVFQYARTQQCVLFFDEFDALGKEREDRQESGEIKRVLNSLLLEVDRLPSYVILIAASNHPDLLDRAIWRRFQIHATLPRPDKAQIERWFALFCTRYQSLDFSLAKRLLPKLIGASYSELQDLVLNVMRRCVLEGETRSDSVFREQLKLWTQTRPKKGVGTNGNASNSHISNSHNRSQKRETTRSSADAPPNSRTAGRKSRTSASKTAAGVRTAKSRT